MAKLLTLYQYPPVWGLPNPSPFCMKLATLMRMMDLPHDVVLCRTPFGSPSGRLPYVNLGGEKLSDSQRVADRLKTELGSTVDDGLNAHQLAHAHVLRRVVENHLYWVLVYERWWWQAGWRHTRVGMFYTLPRGLRRLAAYLVRREACKRLRGHGLALAPTDEIFAWGVEDVAALELLLANGEFFLDDKPRTVDASIYAVLANLMFDPIQSPVGSRVNASKTLSAYCERMRARFWPEFPRMRAR